MEDRYRIISDSCVDYHPSELLGEVNRVPFKVLIDDQEHVDEGSKVLELLRNIGFRAKSIRTACPSPGEFIDAIQTAANAFIVTISGKLSGSYAAAVAAQRQLVEEGAANRILHIFDSKSASAGESLVALKLAQLLSESLELPELIERMNRYIAGMRTFFVLNSMDTLVANGRVSAMKEFALRALRIFPVMGEDGDGKIELKALGRGKKNAFNRMIELIGETKKDFTDAVLAISHCDAYETAVEIKNQLMARYPFKDALILETSGLSSVYASNGGIVVAC